MELRPAPWKILLLALCLGNPVWGQQTARTAIRTAPTAAFPPIAAAPSAAALSSRLTSPSSLSSLAPAPRAAAAPQVIKVPGYGSYVESPAGLLVPRAQAEAQPPSAASSGLELSEALSEPGRSAVETLSRAYDGGGVSPSRTTVETVSLGALAEHRAAAAASESGSALLRSLHERTAQGFHSQEYVAASRYIFSTADNITSHGVRGVVDAYSGIFVPGTSDDGKDYPEHGDENHDGWVDRDGMNIEHTWPQSFFAKAGPMRSDAHHLLPTFKHPNSVRSNLPFGEVTGRPEYSNSAGAKMGGGVFEPPDATKGKVGRAVLYFYTRYYDRRIFQGAYNHAFFEGNLEMFLRWNRQHPPDADEIRRNGLVEKFQGNRNPFIDDPALADRIGVDGFHPSVTLHERAPGRRKHGGRGFRPVGRLSPLDFLLH